MYVESKTLHRHVKNIPKSSFPTIGVPGTVEAGDSNTWDSNCASKFPTRDSIRLYYLWHRLQKTHSIHNGNWNDLRQIVIVTW